MEGWRTKVYPFSSNQLLSSLLDSFLFFFLSHRLQTLRTSMMMQACIYNLPTYSPYAQCESGGFSNPNEHYLNRARAMTEVGIITLAALCCWHMVTPWGYADLLWSAQCVCPHSVGDVYRIRVFLQPAPIVARKYMQHLRFWGEQPTAGCLCIIFSEASIIFQSWWLPGVRCGTSGLLANSVPKAFGKWGKNKSDDFGWNKAQQRTSSSKHF